MTISGVQKLILPLLRAVTGFDPGQLWAIGADVFSRKEDMPACQVTGSFHPCKAVDKHYDGGGSSSSSSSSSSNNNGGSSSSSRSSQMKEKVRSKSSK